MVFSLRSQHNRKFCTWQTQSKYLSVETKCYLLLGLSIGVVSLRLSTNFYFHNATIIIQVCQIKQRNRWKTLDHTLSESSVPTLHTLSTNDSTAKFLYKGICLITNLVMAWVFSLSGNWILRGAWAYQLVVSQWYFHSSLMNNENI